MKKKVQSSSVFSLFTSSVRLMLSQARDRLGSGIPLVTTLRREQWKEVLISAPKKRRVQIGGSLAAFALGSACFLYNQKQVIPSPFVKLPICSRLEDPRFDQVSTACKVYIPPLLHVADDAVCAVPDKRRDGSTICLPSESPSEALFSVFYNWMTKDLDGELQEEDPEIVVQKRSYSFSNSRLSKAEQKPSLRLLFSPPAILNVARASHLCAKEKIKRKKPMSLQEMISWVRNLRDEMDNRAVVLSSRAVATIPSHSLLF